MDSPPPPCSASCDPPSNQTPNTWKMSLLLHAQVSMPLNANINSINLRRACPLARELFYQGLMNQAHNHPHIVYMGRCVSCGQPTGNFCDALCECWPHIRSAGRSDHGRLAHLWPMRRLPLLCLCGHRSTRPDRAADSADRDTSTRDAICAICG